MKKPRKNIPPRLLWQLQFSCYDTHGKFIFTGDSNWQVMVTKLLYMLRENSELTVVALVPEWRERGENPHILIKEVLGELVDRVKLVCVPIYPNALRTRFDFPYTEYARAIKREHDRGKFTHVYMNDPMLTRHFRALFLVEKLGSPTFITQTHFLDSPSSKIVPAECSYWHGTVEGNLKSDVCLWHCDSMQEFFLSELAIDYNDRIVKQIAKKSAVWKSGYSIDEINRSVSLRDLRFKLPNDKHIVFVPNRIGGLGKSFDYTNNGRFMFEWANALYERRQDFVVVAGNPSQKILNDELAEHCKPYIKIVPTTVTRNEYRHICAASDVVVALYTTDTNGGLAALEAIDLGCTPLLPNVYEYKKYFDAVKWPKDLRINPNLSDVVDVLDRILDNHSLSCSRTSDDGIRLSSVGNDVRLVKLRNHIRQTTTYEHTTHAAMQVMGLDAQ